MCFPFFGELKAFLDRYRQHPETGVLREALAGALAGCSLSQTLELYREVLDLAERLLWEEGIPEEALTRYQSLFREYEQLLAQQPEDRRHRFVVVIPVADRPRQLRNCLESLLAHCRAFEYGGRKQGRYPAIRVLIADDSADPAAIEAHLGLAREFSARGLETIHFGQQEQLLELEGRAVPESVVGTAVEGDFAHKGPSRMRNITYLRLCRMTEEEEGPLLFLFLDSDQEFRVLHCSGQGRRELLALNHFHHLDRIFSRGAVTLLTGKVVGDPPVAPAVMAGNFLEDVIAFLTELRQLPAGAPCPFHGGPAGVAGDAAYHDMAELFGFAPAARPHRFSCGVEGDHQREAVLGDFARRLDRFFDGEHPTRITCHQFSPALESVQPARTVYTGNYVMDRRGLRYFIPFADLRLRMAGPVLGRILRSELGNGFVSANLPLLHKRTLEELGESEFRPGVERRQGRVDLSREFERQFFGDVMLFSVERLAEQGFPGSAPAPERIATTVEEIAAWLRLQYGEKRRQIRQRMMALEKLLADGDAWWNHEPAAAASLEAFRRFLENMEANFGDSSRGQLLAEDEAQQRRLRQIAAAIGDYRKMRRQWEQALEL